MPLDTEKYTAYIRRELDLRREQKRSSDAELLEFFADEDQKASALRFALHRAFAKDFLELKLYTAALGELQVAEKYAALDADMLYWRGLCCSELGREEEAIEALRSCLGLEPKHEEANTLLGKLQKQEQNTTKREGLLRKIALALFALLLLSLLVLAIFRTLTGETAAPPEQSEKKEARQAKEEGNYKESIVENEAQAKEEPKNAKAQEQVSQESETSNKHRIIPVLRSIFAVLLGLALFSFFLYAVLSRRKKRKEHKPKPQELMIQEEDTKANIEENNVPDALVLAFKNMYKSARNTRKAQTRKHERLLRELNTQAFFKKLPQQGFEYAQRLPLFVQKMQRQSLQMVEAHLSKDFAEKGLSLELAQLHISDDEAKLYGILTSSQGSIEGLSISISRKADRGAYQSFYSGAQELICPGKPALPQGQKLYFALDMRRKMELFDELYIHLEQLQSNSHSLALPAQELRVLSLRTRLPNIKFRSLGWQLQQNTQGSSSLDLLLELENQEQAPVPLLSYALVLLDARQQELHRHIFYLAGLGLPRLLPGECFLVKQELTRIPAAKAQHVSGLRVEIQEFASSQPILSTGSLFTVAHSQTAHIPVSINKESLGSRLKLWVEKSKFLKKPQATGEPSSCTYFFAGSFSLQNQEPALGIERLVFKLQGFDKSGKELFSSLSNSLFYFPDNPLPTELSKNYLGSKTTLKALLDIDFQAATAGILHRVEIEVLELGLIHIQEQEQEA